MGVPPPSLKSSFGGVGALRGTLRFRAATQNVAAPSPPGA